MDHAPPGKSDALDAHAVAQLLREEQASLSRVLAEAPMAAALQLWSRLREDIVTDLTRVRNRLHAQLLQCDPEYQRRQPSLTSQAGLRAVLDYCAPGPTVLDRAREQAVRRLAEQMAQLSQHERELRWRLEHAVEAQCAPLLLIDGSGPLVAAGLVAELGPPRSGLGVA